MTSAVAGVQYDRVEDDTDVLRQRLVQALEPAGVEGAHKSGGQPKPKPYPEMAWRKSPSTDASYLLDVAQLSLTQRVLVQLNAVGLVTGDSVQVGGLVVKRALKMLRIQHVLRDQTLSLSSLFLKSSIISMPWSAAGVSIIPQSTDVVR